MNAEKFSEAMGELDSRYIDEAVRYHPKTRKRLWARYCAAAACLALLCAAAIFFFPADNRVVSFGPADAPPMIFINDTLYQQSPSQTSFPEPKDDFVYLGVIESDITNFQGTDDAGDCADGIPKENAQANHPIVGAKVYQYGDSIVAAIDGRYWLYERADNASDWQGELTEEEKMQLDPSWRAGE